MNTKVFLNHTFYRGSRKTNLIKSLSYFCTGDSGENNSWKCSKCAQVNIDSESRLCPVCFQCINPNEWDLTTDPSHIVSAYEDLMNKPTSESPSPNDFILDFHNEARNEALPVDRQHSTQVIRPEDFGKSSNLCTTLLEYYSELDEFAQKNKMNTLAFCKLVSSIAVLTILDPYVHATEP